MTWHTNKEVDAAYEQWQRDRDEEEWYQSIAEEVRNKIMRAHQARMARQHQELLAREVETSESDNPED